MKITSVGYNFKHDKYFKLLRPNGMNDFLFIIIRSPALCSINNDKIHISEDTMIFISKNTPHSLCADGDLYINDWVTVNFDEHEYPLIHKSINLNTFMNSSDVQLCSNMIKYIQDENASTNPNKQNTCDSLFNVILNKLRDNSNQNYSRKYYNKLKFVRDTIYSNPCKNYSIKSLSSIANLSNSYFQNLYKSYFNISPISDVINSRIEYSKQLLMSTNYSVAKIAEMLGYSTDSRFIKQFKLLTKTTPNRYRDQCSLKH